MTMKFTETSYTNKTEILMYPDHYVADAHTFLKNDAAASTVNGRKIIKAGTIYPANDATAIGVVFQDIDVTDGDAAGALLVHGFVDASKLPAEPVANAQSALHLIKFYNLSSQES